MSVEDFPLGCGPCHAPPEVQQRWVEAHAFGANTSGEEGISNIEEDAEDENEVAEVQVSEYSEYFCAECSETKHRVSLPQRMWAQRACFDLNRTMEVYNMSNSKLATEMLERSKCDEFTTSPSGCLIGCRRRGERQIVEYHEGEAMDP